MKHSSTHNHNSNCSIKIKIRIIRKSFDYWYPGTNFIDKIIKKYSKHIENGDILAISDKALSTALGNIYDEENLCVDIITKILTFIVVKFFWARLARIFFKSQNVFSIFNNTPLNIIAVHKKIALRYGGFRHFLKPLSEAGVDTTNLPYNYVSLPLRNIDNVVKNIQSTIYKCLKKYVNILVIDSDKTYRIKWLKNIAFATRYSSLKNVLDLGVISYIAGKKFKKLFISYPTPVAYKGINLGLPLLLRIAKLAEKFMGWGLGRNAVEMLMNLGKKNFSEITWSDMNSVAHYPVVLIKLKIMRICSN